MFRNCLWDHIKMMPILLTLMFFGIPSLAAQETTSQSSITSLEDAPLVSLELTRAAKEGNLQNVTDLIAQGADVNFHDGISIRWASENGHVEVVKYLLEAGANPNSTDDTKIPYGMALVLAARNNHLDIITLLLNAGVTLKPFRHAESALGQAAENGHLEAVQKLIEAGADVHYRGDGPLRFAARKGHLDIVKALIQAGATIHDLAINNAADKGHLEVLRTLTEGGGVTTEDLGEALSHAASSGHLEVVKFLLAKGADPNYEGTLKGAARYGRLEVVRTLLEAGANLTCEGKALRCPWHYAAENGYPDVIALLVQYGADINSALKSEVIVVADVISYEKGWTALHFAADSSQLIMQQLLDLGANINVQDARGRTPLHVAVDDERLIVAKELLRFCPDVTLTDGEGKTALDIARDLALRNASEFSTYEVLVTTLQKVMSEEIASTPQNQAGLSGLVREFLAIVEANSTLKEQLRDYVKNPNFVSQALYQLFEERARKGMVTVIKDHTCKVSIQEEGTIAVGTEYLARCDCTPGQGPHLTFTLRKEENLCAPISPVKAEEGLSKLPKPEESAG